MTVPVAILGASGYAGGELVRLVDLHPDLAAVHLGAHRAAGRRLGEVHPHLDGADRVLGSLDPDAVAASGAELAFLALPHGASTEPAMALLEQGVRVIDLGSDFRLDTPDRYAAAYGTAHPRPDQLGAWAYGLPELFDVADTDRVAVPGCYPTAALLALGPLARTGTVATSGVVVDAMSGVSGAGRALREDLLFGAVDESVRAYKVLEHRHQPEMERALEAVAGRGATLIFTPHLVPMQRGILTTCYVPVAPGVAAGDLRQALDDAYAEARFVEVVDDPPQTRWVVGSNRALVSVHLDERTATAVVLSAIDNLLKGAAGQAVQCANLVLGLPEDAGLPAAGWMP